MPKRTFQPKKRKAAKQHGFFKRMKTRAGKTVIKKRMAKGRKRVAARKQLIFVFLTKAHSLFNFKQRVKIHTNDFSKKQI